MTTRAAPTSVIQKDFIEAGMIDKKICTYPDFYKMIETCRRKLKKEEVDLCIETFVPLYEHMSKYGHIPDEVFEVSDLKKI